MATTPTATPPDQIVAEAAKLAPLLRRNAAWSEANRRISDESIEALADIGVFRLRTPVRYGGLECGTEQLIRVGSEIGRADGSTGWVAAVYWIPTWMAAMFPDDVQDEVFATPDTRICGTLSPSATALPAKGGAVVNGKWSFITGALHAQWQVIIAILAPPDGQPLPVVALVPMSDLHVVDDWHTTGMRGTGSVSTVARDLFVPEDRILPLPVVLQGQTRSVANQESPIYRAPLLPVASASSVGPVLGMAQGIQDVFMKRLPDRKITYTGYSRQIEAPLTHLQVAEATTLVDEAEFHAHRLASTVDRKAADGAAWTLLERARARADLGAVCRLAKQAADIYATASGGSSIYSDVPVQRFRRDIDAVNLHALMHPDTNTELYGRVLCGLGPDTDYV